VTQSKGTIICNGWTHQPPAVITFTRISFFVKDISISMTSLKINTLFLHVQCMWPKLFLLYGRTLSQYKSYDSLPHTILQRDILRKRSASRFHKLRANTVAVTHDVHANYRYLCLRRSCPVQPDHGASVEEGKDQSSEKQEGCERERSHLFEK
jgi:hypothetical protein